MIDRSFWEEAQRAWIVKAPPKIKEVKTGSGGSIDPMLLKDPWELDEVPFEWIDEEKAFDAVVNGKDIPLKIPVSQAAEPEPELEPEVPKRPKLDAEKFDALLEKQTIPEYIEACKLLRVCELPERMDELYSDLIDRMKVLNDADDKFNGVYSADLSQFYEYYIPEALQLTSTYLEYLDVGIAEQIISETENEVMDAVEKLLIAVNEKIDEIYRFASIEIKAKAKALDSIMGQDGYVNPEYKINNTEG